MLSSTSFSTRVSRASSTLISTWRIHNPQHVATGFGSISTRFLSTLGQLKPARGSTKNIHRVGRGPGSGSGKTAGRGQKGQKARAKVKPWFEGGQTPLFKLFPKVGFKSMLPKSQELNLNTLQRLIDQNKVDATKPITMRELYRTRFFGRMHHGVKLLAGTHDLFTTPNVKITVSKASAQAIEKIEQLGGTVTTQYYTRFGLRVLKSPDHALEKFGRIPLRARPIDRRSIEYYRDPARKGYLVGVGQEPRIKPKYVAKKKQSPLVTLVEELKSVPDHYSVNASKGFFKHHRA